MKKLVFISLCCLLSLAMPVNVQAYSLDPYFDDIPDTHWAFEYVQRLYEAAITYGCNPPDNNLYCPGDYVTRAQMAAYVMRTADYMIDSEIMPTVLSNDGTGSTLDADLLDGQHASSFAASSHPHSGADITTGTVADERIASTIARDSEVTTQVDAHANRADNPHSVTAIQVGASPDNHDHDGSYVNSTGDTMTGTLNLPSNGLTVGTNQLVVSGGNVGIGTTSPNELLEINKSFNGFTGLRIDNPSAGANTESGIDFYIGNKRGKIGVERTTLDLVIENSNTQSGANIMFNTSGGTPGTRMTITGDGKVGVGTTSPNYNLDILDNDASALRVKSNGSNSFIVIDKGASTSYGYVRFSTNNSELWTLGNYGDDNFRLRHIPTSNNVLYANTSGNIGIGTTSPQSTLQVNGYTQLALTSGSPPSADCDEASERGRMKVDNSAGLLYICVDSGWVAK